MIEYKWYLNTWKKSLPWFRKTEGRSRALRLSGFWRHRTVTVNGPPLYGDMLFSFPIKLDPPPMSLPQPMHHESQVHVSALVPSVAPHVHPNPHPLLITPTCFPVSMIYQSLSISTETKWDQTNTSYNSGVVLLDNGKRKFVCLMITYENSLSLKGQWNSRTLKTSKWGIRTKLLLIKSDNHKHIIMFP